MAATDSVAVLAGEASSFADLWALLAHDDPLVRSRAADAAVKASRARPSLLAPFAADLFSGDPDEGGQALVWHLLPVAARLELKPEQAARLMRRCEDALLNHSSHVAPEEALSAAFTLAAGDRRHVARARSLARIALKSHSAPLAARARQLLDGR